MVLRGGANHRGAADVDVLDAIVVVGALRDSGLERIEVHNEQIDRADVVREHRGFVLGVLANRKQAAMHRRMQRLHAPVHHFREAVTSDTSRTAMPASAMALHVPPVEISSTPAALSARAKSMRPVLSETERSAREMRRRSRAWRQAR